MKILISSLIILLACSICIAQSTVNIYDTVPGRKSIVEVVCPNGKAYKLLVWNRDLDSQAVRNWVDEINATYCNKGK